MHLCIGPFLYSVDKLTYYKSMSSTLSVIDVFGADNNILSLPGQTVDISYRNFKLHQFKIVDIDFNAEQNKYTIFGEEFKRFLLFLS